MKKFLLTLFLVSLAPLIFLAPSLLAEEPLYVTITSPEAGVPVFGEFEIVADVFPAEKVEEVEFFVDGRFAGRRTEPPFAVYFDVGQQNVSHRIEVVARGTAPSGEALLVTPRIRVDDEMDLSLQQLYVNVTRGGERLDGLSARSFTVLDNGEPQELVTFERGDVPLTAVLLVDSSSSMRGMRLQAALAGARHFADAMAPLDLAKVILFSDRVLHSTPFTGFSEVLSAGLGGVEADGGTAINDHLYASLKLVGERQGRQVIILLSDGVDVSSLLSMDDVAWAARRSQALIYWIRLGRRVRPPAYGTAWRGSRQNQHEVETLENVVRQSGGRIVVIDTVAQTCDAFAVILADLRGQYVLGYYPTTQKRDGSWHNVEVGVQRVDVEVRTRDGYLDQ